MNLIGLKGFGLYYGRIDRYFTHGWFPGNLNWRAAHVEQVIRGARAMYGMEEYLLVGFSDGGTLAYEVAAADPWCAGLIVHSGLWRGPREPLAQPMLLLVTAGDRTPTTDATWRAYHHYEDLGCDVSMAELCALRFRPRHQFANGLVVMWDWVLSVFGQKLPVEPKWLERSENETVVIHA